MSRLRRPRQRYALDRSWSARFAGTNAACTPTPTPSATPGQTPSATPVQTPATTPIVNPRDDAARGWTVTARRPETEPNSSGSSTGNSNVIPGPVARAPGSTLPLATAFPSRFSASPVLRGRTPTVARSREGNNPGIPENRSGPSGQGSPLRKGKSVQGGGVHMDRERDGETRRVQAIGVIAGGIERTLTSVESEVNNGFWVLFRVESTSESYWLAIRGKPFWSIHWFLCFWAGSE